MRLEIQQQVPHSVVNKTDNNGSIHTDTEQVVSKKVVKVDGTNTLGEKERENERVRERER